ncbi:MAG TPA: DEAD/DEAH box helicase [Polyangiales bacterium]|nr:DEAD/DEAH box helicase [Polyangiales bacterium]
MKSYGTAELKDGYWHVQCEPHVMLRLKRLFGGVSKASFGVAKIKATDEISRDLLWFTQRFPLEVVQRPELEQRAQRHLESAEMFERLISGETQPQQFDLALPARDYQRVAASLMLAARGLLLADELGCGKTLSAICALTDPRARPALVVTLAHLPMQWEREIKRFCPRLRTHIVKKGTPYDVRGGQQKSRRRKLLPGQTELIEPEFPDVLIINYHKLAGWAAALAGVVKSVTFDEGQELRIDDSDKARAARHIAASCDFRFSLTGTPIYNYGDEFYNVLSVLRPDAMGEREEFLREWCSGEKTIKDPKAFGTYLRESGLMLRRTRKDIARELPPVSRGEYHVDADQDALTEAEDAASELARIILAKDTAWEVRGQAMREIDWRLRQATGIAKAAHVAAFVKMLVENGESVVVYAWHRAVHDVLVERLKDFNPVLFTGSESPTQKEASREAFCKGESKVLIMSLRAGAGLDGLQYACRTVVFAELDWSPGVHHQAEGRVFRDGQPDPVSVYYLVSDSGSDPFLSETLGLKRGQIEGVIDPDAELVTKLSSNAADGIRRIAEKYLSSTAAKAS